MKRLVLVLMSLFIFLCVCGFDSPSKKVYDNANLLSESEEESLNRLCMDAREKVKADFVIVTVDSLDGKSVEAYADNFYDEMGFGYEKKMGTGSIILISMKEREFTFSTSGDCVDLFSKAASDKIIHEVSPFLSEGNYYEAFTTYVAMTKEYIENGGEWNESKVTDILICIFLALIVAFIAVWIMCSGSKSKMTVNGYTYANGHKSDIIRQHDVYIRTSTIRRHIETTPSGGGNGGSRIGSSGNRHGGSSGKF